MACILTTHMMMAWMVVACVAIAFVAVVRVGHNCVGPSDESHNYTAFVPVVRVGHNCVGHSDESHNYTTFVAVVHIGHDYVGGRVWPLAGWWNSGELDANLVRCAFPADRCAGYVAGSLVCSDGYMTVWPSLYIHVDHNYIWPYPCRP